MLLEHNVYACMCRVCMCEYRQQQKLKQYDSKHDQLQRKEKGFMLYVNGANAASVAAPPSTKTARTARRPKSCNKSAVDGMCYC